MAKLLVALLCLTAAPAFAGQQYCGDDADTYYIEKIPHGFAIVRGAYSDFCKQDHMSDNTLYVCDGDEAYTMDFKEAGDRLDVQMPDGSHMAFEACTIETPR